MEREALGFYDDGNMQVAEEGIFGVQVGASLAYIRLIGKMSSRTHSLVPAYIPMNPANLFIARA